VLKIIDYILFGLGGYEGRERHVVQFFYPILLVGLFGRVNESLDFKHCPFVSPQNKEIWDALLILSVVLQNDAAWKYKFEFLD